MIDTVIGLIGAALAVQAGTPPPAAPSGTIFATIDHSEWCQAGSVTIDVATGRYMLTRGLDRSVCDMRTVRREVTHGTLAADRLASIRAAYARVEADGMVAAACRNGGKPSDLVVSNGGPQALVLTGAFATQIAPTNLACWSREAYQLHRLLDRSVAR